MSIKAAIAYHRRGFQPVVVPAGRKGPVTKGWQSQVYTEAELATRFAGKGNIGLLLGPSSRNLVDVDLDCREARTLADKFLPGTPSVTGRPGTPRAHRWYIAKDVKTTQYHDPQTKTMIVELRGTGAQTLVGPSIHPESGEPYDMLDGEPTSVASSVLAACVKALADAVIEARYGKQAVRVNASKPRPRPTCRPVRGVVPDDDAVYCRAVAYLDAMPSAISGSGGHNATYIAAVAMVHGFGLDPDVACALLIDQYNPRCQPAWSEKQIRHKIDDAASKAHDYPHGWLRDAQRQHRNRTWSAATRVEGRTVPVESARASRVIPTVPSVRREVACA